MFRPQHTFYHAPIIVTGLFLDCIVTYVHFILSHTFYSFPQSNFKFAILLSPGEALEWLGLWRVGLLEALEGGPGARALSLVIRVEARALAVADGGPEVRRV